MQKEPERARSGLQQLTMMMLAVSGVVFATTAKVLADPVTQTNVPTNQSTTLFGKTSLGGGSQPNSSSQNTAQDQRSGQQQAIISAAAAADQVEGVNRSAQQVVSQAASEVTQTTSLAAAAVSDYPEQATLQQIARQTNSQQQQVSHETIQIRQIAGEITSQTMALRRLVQFSDDDQLLTSAVQQATSMAGDLSLLADQMRSFAVIANGWREIANNNAQTIQQLLVTLSGHQNDALPGQPAMLWQPNVERFMPVVSLANTQLSMPNTVIPQRSSSQPNVAEMSMQLRATPREAEHLRQIQLSEQLKAQRSTREKVHDEDQRRTPSKAHRHTSATHQIVRSKKISRLNESRQTPQFLSVLVMILVVTLIYRMIVHQVIVIKDGQYLIARNGQVTFAPVSVNSATVLSNYFAAKRLLTGEHGYVIVSAHKFKAAIRKKARK